MSAQKSVVGMVLYARNESAYNAAAFALTGSTDTIDLTGEPPVFNIQYAVEGNRGGGTYSRGQLQRSAPSVRSTAGTIKVHVKGAGTSYSSSVRPPNSHAFLQASGLSGSLNGGTWVYTPTPLGTAPSSLALDVYGMGELLQVRGAYATFTMTPEGALPVLTFEVQGLQSGSVSDVASVPLRVFQAQNVIPPKLESIQLQIGAYAPKVRSFTYTHGLEIAPRVDLNSVNAHAGFAIGRHVNTFTVQIEADALSSFNPYADFDAGTARNISMTIGSVANNRATLNLANCVLTSVTKVALDNNVAGLDLTYAPSTSPDTNTDVTLTFN